MSNGASNSVDAAAIDWTAIPTKAIKVITSPIEFFRSMPKSGGFLEPLVFAIVMGVVAGLLYTVKYFLGFNLVGGMFVGVASIIVVPIVFTIVSFIWAAIMFVVWSMMGSKENYETAYRCVAYTYATVPVMALLEFVPYIYLYVSLAGLAWGLFLTVTASVQAHKIPERRAWTVFGIIGGILALFVLSGIYAAHKLEGFAHDMEKMKKEMESEDYKGQVEQWRKEMEKYKQNQ